jgi:hypothetical protein
MRINDVFHGKIYKFVGNIRNFFIDMKRIIKTFALLVTCCIPFIMGCNKDRFNVDVSDIEVDISVKRLEKDLFTLPLNKDSIMHEIPMLQDKYGDFLDLYTSGYLNDLGKPGTELFADKLLAFITNYQFNKIYRETMAVFPDLNDIEESLEEAFKHYKYYFPESVIPKLITCIISTYQSIVVDEGVIGVSIDKYLGVDSEVYKKVGFQQYKRCNMHPGKVVPDVVQSLAATEFPFNDSINNLLANMVHEGKIMYFMDAMLPEMHDTLKFGFTGRQLNFCHNNEAKMWGTMVEKKILFATDKLTIKKYVGEGPFTADFTRESPARAAVWIGRQIVKKYMKKNADVTLEELMKLTDYQGILRDSGYNP